jgi:hypothetical protein
MIPRLLLVPLGLLMMAAPAVAADRKARAHEPITGKVKEVFPQKDVLILTVRHKNEERTMEIKVSGETKFVVFVVNGRRKTFESFEEACKADLFPPEAEVKAFLAPDGTARAVIRVFLDDKHRLPITARQLFGRIKDFDAKKRVLRIAVADESESRVVAVQFLEKTEFVVADGKDGSKTMTREDAVKADQFQAGKQVKVMLDSGGWASRIVALAGFKVPKKGPKKKS